MKFISRFREYTIFIHANGRYQAIRFHDMGKQAGASVFVTTDEAIANALKRKPNYNKDYYIEGEEEVVEEPVVEEHVYDNVYDYVKRTQSAIDVLVKNHNVKRSELKVKADVLKKAEELNISFPNL